MSGFESELERIRAAAETSDRNSTAGHAPDTLPQVEATLLIAAQLEAIVDRLTWLCEIAGEK